jgi:hypothetical protein
MLQFDLNEILREELLSGDRPEDGMMHPSGDIVGPLRHTMLRMAGAPEKPDTIASQIRLETGTMWHARIGKMLEKRGLPVMREVSATAGLPPGWAGTADLMFWSEADRGFVLCDVKTTKGEGLTYIARDGIKTEHYHQLSAYWNAFAELGYPMVNRALVWYIPMNEDYKVVGGVEPLIPEVMPMEYASMWPLMNQRRHLVDEYLESQIFQFLNAKDGDNVFLTDKLAEPMPREQKLFKDKDKWNLTLIPHWSAMFCPYDDSLCNCGGDEGDAKTTKIGHFEAQGGAWVYVPRAGYEDYEPNTMPKVKVPSGG